MLLNTMHLIEMSVDKTPHPTNTMDWIKRFAPPYHNLSRALVLWWRSDPTPAAVCVLHHIDPRGKFLPVALEQ